VLEAFEDASFMKSPDLGDMDFVKRIMAFIGVALDEMEEPKA
jgi:hypothetical protein